MSEVNKTATTTPRRSRIKRIVLATVIFTGGTLTGAAAVTGAAAYAWGGGHGGWHKGGEWSAEQSKGRARDRMAWVLGRVDATEEQEAKIGAIVDGAIDELAPIVMAHKGKRQALIAALSAPTVDAQALETLRSEAVDLMTSGSEVLTRSVTEGVAVLTVEQRQTLVSSFAKHRR
jgi:periplasmic protein CpxP/Spy